MKVYFCKSNRPPKNCSFKYELEYVKCQELQDDGEYISKQYCYPKIPPDFRIWGEARECLDSSPEPSFRLLKGVARMGNALITDVELVMFCEENDT